MEEVLASLPVAPLDADNLERNRHDLEDRFNAVRDAGFYGRFSSGPRNSCGRSYSQTWRRRPASCATECRRHGIIFEVIAWTNADREASYYPLLDAGVTSCNRLPDDNRANAEKYYADDVVSVNSCAARLPVVGDRRNPLKRRQLTAQENIGEEYASYVELTSKVYPYCGRSDGDSDVERRRLRGESSSNRGAL